MSVHPNNNTLIRNCSWGADIAAVARTGTNVMSWRGGCKPQSTSNKNKSCQVFRMNENRGQNNWEGCLYNPNRPLYFIKLLAVSHLIPSLFIISVAWHLNLHQLEIMTRKKGVHSLNKHITWGTVSQTETGLVRGQVRPSSLKSS